ncbi:uncharacterized protein Z518_09292 [Rhinocladiella mackenziei CBS 650.93]|uniref:Transcription factor domain-containing protein n=1 Tax=Rhinocladiella mackenziei CBS 650.93 TaxID=1442369 RepID=A0A0D2IE99_9EURO|nr:uncharacterized protein Z518_09292 [Rhinocladiella mackenziei CBS 650.93]KIX01566.1 hypothetical protein Z518_09292 [Rhinocladiella mackenziei CBS 650.93]
MASARDSQSSQSVSASTPAIIAESDTPCAVCRRPRCQLQSHKAYLAGQRRGGDPKPGADKPRRPPYLDDLRLPDTSYSRSYAFTRALPSTVPHSVSSGRLDGFHDLPVPGGHQPELHHAVYSLLNFKIGAATAFPLPVGLAVNDIGGSMTMPVMTDTSLCLSVIAAWRAVQILIGQAPEYLYLSYEAQAFQSLRKQLLDQGPGGVTDQAVMAAALLWATSTMFAQAEALRRHAAGVRALVMARRGLDNLGYAGSVKQLILWADFLTAQFLGEDVSFKDVGPMTPMPVSLVKLRNSIVIPPPFDCLLPQTLKAAQDLRLLLISHDHAMRTGRISIAEYKALMSLLNQSTINRIGLEVRYKNSKTIDECVVLAMNLLRFTVLFHAGPLFIIVAKVIERLRTALVRSGVDQWLSCIDIFIWACFVGMVNNFENQNREHFVNMAGRALTIKYKNRWPGDWRDDILSVLRSFLWSDAILTDLFPKACQWIERPMSSPDTA